MSGKVKIYLDTRYWILLRDHVLGARTSEAISKTYDLIKNACASGIAICPIGEDVLYEVTKQTVPVSLLTTVRLIDTLSQGVCSLSHNERVRAEALASLSQGEFGYIEGVGVPVWTKLPFFLRSFVPVAPALGADQSQIQIAFTNHLWEISLEAMLNSAGPGFVENYPRYPNLSSLMNQDYDERKDEFNSFQKVFMSELRWEVERFVPEFEAAMADIYYRKSGRVVAQESADAEEARRVLRNVVYKLFSLKKSGKYFPSLFVAASLSAAIWWDRNRRYKENDVWDFGHAQVAIPYCDFFLTEANLKNFALSRHLGFEGRFRCKILSEPAEICENLERSFALRVGSNE